jgi:hypothetical protein
MNTNIIDLMRLIHEFSQQKVDLFSNFFQKIKFFQ